MIKNMNLQIENIGPVIHADINLKKLNIVAGQNATGKSTVSKLLYCFLRASSSQSQYIVTKNLTQHLHQLSFILRRIISDEETKNKIFEFESDLGELCIPFFRKDKPINISIEELKELMNDFQHLFHSVYNFNELDSNNSSQLDVIKNIEADLNGLEEDILSLNDSEKLYESLIHLLLFKEFGIDISKESNLGTAGLNNPFFNYKIDFKENEIFLENWVEIPSVYYIDSFSIFDNEKKGLFTTDHVINLQQDLKDDSRKKQFGDERKYKDIIEVEKDICEIIGGEIRYKNDQFIFYPNEGEEFVIVNCASGIKQIAVIQVLLANRMINTNSFLIFDEPEVNLHPEWQVKIAKILVKLATKAGINIYINSYSPLFVEALEVYSAKYNINEDTSFYLSEFDEKGYVFNEVHRDDLIRLYDNLGNPYDLINEIRAENMLKGIF